MLCEHFYNAARADDVGDDDDDDEGRMSWFEV